MTLRREVFLAISQSIDLRRESVASWSDFVIEMEGWLLGEEFNFPGFNFTAVVKVMEKSEKEVAAAASTLLPVDGMR